MTKPTRGLHQKEPFRVFTTGKLIKDGADYFGPYTSMKTVRTLLELLRSLYPMRTCNYDLSAPKIEAGKYKLCLEYHLGNCEILVGKIAPEAYA